MGMGDRDVTRRETLRARYTVLSECLLIVEAIKRRFSKDEANYEAKAGYEDAYAEEDRRLQVLRALMQEIRDEESLIVMEMYGVTPRKGRP